MNRQKILRVALAFAALASLTTGDAAMARVHGRVGVFIGPGFAYPYPYPYPYYGPYPGYYYPPVVVAQPAAPPQYVEQGADGQAVAVPPVSGSNPGMSGPQSPPDPGPQYGPQPGSQSGPQAGPPPGARPAQGIWYHCDRPEGYYPYIQSCPGGWRKVPAQPPA